MMFVGVDVHKRACQAAVVDEDGGLIDELRFPNTIQGIESLIERVRGYGEFQVVMESSANYWTRLYDRLESEGVPVKLSNPYKTRAIAEARIKTDKLDAKTLAQLLRADLVAECYVPAREDREKRALIRHRASLVKTRTEVRNRVHSLLDKHELTHDYSNLFGRKGTEWLRELPHLDQVILKSELHLLDTLDEEVERVSREIARLAVDDDQVKLLMGLKGINYYSAMLLLSEIGEIHRFSTPEKLSSWAGLAPRTHQSGEVCWNGRITKRGNRRIRWVLGQSAQTPAAPRPQVPYVLRADCCEEGSWEGPGGGLQEDARRGLDRAHQERALPRTGRRADHEKV
jgi:transposase